MNKSSLFALAIKPIKVNIPSLGQEIYIRELSYKGAVEVASRQNPIDRAVFTMIYSVCDAKGKLMFSTNDLEQIADTFSFATIQEIAVEVAKITKIDPSNTVK